MYCDHGAPKISPSTRADDDHQRNGSLSVRGYLTADLGCGHECAGMNMEPNNVDEALEVLHRERAIECDEGDPHVLMDCCLRWGLWCLGLGV